MKNSSLKTALLNLFTQNIGLKLASLVLAIILWLIVVNVTDPVMAQTYRNVSVKILNESSVSEDGKTMEIMDGSDVVSTVTIKAPRSVIRELGSSNENISIIADMNSLSADETWVPLVASTTKYADKVENIRLSSERLKVQIENKKTKQLLVQTTTVGETADGYVVGHIQSSQNQVKVTGPESLVDKIASAKVEVEVEGFVEDITTSSDIVLYDADGNLIESRNIKLNTSAVRVEVQILATKTVPIKFETMGTPAEGYAATGEIEAQLDEIMIAGKLSALESVDSITVPGEALNINGLTSTLRALVSLSSFLPSDIVLADGISAGRINVVVYIEPVKAETFSAYLRNIALLYVPDGFTGVEWDTEKDYVEFVLVGLEKDLNKVQISNLALSIDFSDYELMNNVSGYKLNKTYKLPLLMDLPDGVTIKEPVEIPVKLVK